MFQEWWFWCRRVSCVCVCFEERIQLGNGTNSDTPEKCDEEEVLTKRGRCDDLCGHYFTLSLSTLMIIVVMLTLRGRVGAHVRSGKADTILHNSIRLHFTAFLRIFKWLLWCKYTMIKEIWYLTFQSSNLFVSFIKEANITVNRRGWLELISQYTSNLSFPITACSL